jgi:hypothetical protein
MLSLLGGQAGSIERECAWTLMLQRDGSNKLRKQAVFTNCNPLLSDAVAELVRSLGAKARVFPVLRHGFGLTVTSYDVVFSPMGFNPFLLPRKAELVRPATTRATRRVLQVVERLEEVQLRQLAVASEDGTLLVGAEMLPVVVGHRPFVASAG